MRGRKSLIALLCACWMMLGVIAQPARALADEQGRDVSRFVHTTILQHEETASDQQFISWAVSYTMEQGKVHEGDYITVRMPNALSGVGFALDPKHFKSFTPVGDGEYRLIFKEKPDGVGGTFALNFTAENSTKDLIIVRPSINGVESILKISGRVTGGSGVYKPVEKYADTESWLGHGGYLSYDKGDDHIQVGTYIPSEARKATFRIDVNKSNEKMWRAVVTDDIPQLPGFRYNGDVRVEGGEGLNIQNRSTGNHIEFEFDYLEPNQHPSIIYTMTIEPQTKLKLHNDAKIKYTDGQGHEQIIIDRYLLKPGNGYSAVDAFKQVDKAFISGMAEDQQIVYTIVFNPDADFEKGGWKLDDRLDPNVDYVIAIGAPELDITYHQDTHTVHIENKERVSLTKEYRVMIVVDASKAPEGAKIINTVGNTVTTEKYDGRVVLEGVKTIDGQKPGAERFKFKLSGRIGERVIEAIAENDNDGRIRFAPIPFANGDLGKTYRLSVEEIGETKGFNRDASIYEVAITPSYDTDTGKFHAEQVITKSGQPVEHLSFNNEKKSAEGDLVLHATKQVDGQTPGERQFEFSLTGEGQNQVAKSGKGDGVIAFEKISYTNEALGKTYRYEIKEISDVEGLIRDTSVYTVTVTPTDEDDDGKIETTVSIEKDGEPAERILFNNKTEQPPSESASSSSEQPPSESVSSSSEQPPSESASSNSEQPPSESASSSSEQPPSESASSSSEQPPSESVSSSSEQPPSESVSSSSEQPPSESASSSSEQPPSESISSSSEQPPSESASSSSEQPPSESASSSSEQPPSESASSSSEQPPSESVSSSSEHRLSPRAPKTGDESHVVLYAGLAAGAALVIVGWIILSRCSRHD